MRKDKISKADRSEIVKNILEAKDKKAQLKIEADLHLTSTTVIKELLKDAGVNLKIFNGGNHKKKRIEDEIAEETIITPVDEIASTEEVKGLSVGLGEDNPGESWTPAEDEIRKVWVDLSIPPVEPLPDSSTCEVVAANSIDINLLYKRFKQLVHEKKQCEELIREIDIELQTYTETCTSILELVKEGGDKA